MAYITPTNYSLIILYSMRQVTSQKSDRWGVTITITQSYLYYYCCRGNRMTSRRGAIWRHRPATHPPAKQSTPSTHHHHRSMSTAPITEYRPATATAVARAKTVRIRKTVTVSAALPPSAFVVRLISRHPLKNHRFRVIVCSLCSCRLPSTLWFPKCILHNSLLIYIYAGDVRVR